MPLPQNTVPSASTRAALQSGGRGVWSAALGSVIKSKSCRRIWGRPTGAAPNFGKDKDAAQLVNPPAYEHIGISIAYQIDADIAFHGFWTREGRTSPGRPSREDVARGHYRSHENRHARQGYPYLIDGAADHGCAQGPRHRGAQ